MVIVLTSIEWYLVRFEGDPSDHPICILSRNHYFVDEVACLYEHVASSMAAVNCVSFWIRQVSFLISLICFSVT